MSAKNSKLVKGRERKVYVSALNIVLQPHNTNLYIDLLNEIFKSDGSVKVRGQSAIMFGSCRPIDNESPETGLYGVIYKFFKLDQNEPWFNIKTKSEADKSEKNIISIPEHLKPHLQEFPFIFYPKGHRFYFISKRSGQQLSTKFMLDFFEKMVKRPEFSRFGSVKFTVEPERDVIEKIFKLKRLKKLYLDIYPPNPDDQESAEEKMQRRLKSQNIKRMENIYTEASPSGIKPDEETKVIANIAASNGKVTATGLDAGGKSVSLSTKKHPMVKEMTYDSNSSTERVELQEFSRVLHDSIMRPL